MFELLEVRLAPKLNDALVSTRPMQLPEPSRGSVWLMKKLSPKRVQYPSFSPVNVTILLSKSRFDPEPGAF
jgi:hypothetical protein